MQKIYLIRHGETSWNALNKHTGRSNIDLNEKGVLQTKKLQPFFSEIPFDHVLCSPLKRCINTCKNAGLQPQTMDELMEWDYGNFEGKTSEDIQKEIPNWNIFSHGAPGGESVADLEKRGNKVLQHLSSLKGVIAVFSHGHFSRVLGALWIGLSVDMGKHFSLSNAGICVLDYEKKERAIAHWNRVL